MRTLKSHEIQSIAGANAEDNLICFGPAFAFAFTVTPAIVLTSPVAVAQSLYNGETLGASIAQGFNHLGHIKGAYDLVYQGCSGNPYSQGE